MEETERENPSLLAMIQVNKRSTPNDACFDARRQGARQNSPDLTFDRRSGTLSKGIWKIRMD